MEIFAYGEDALTLWAIKDNLAIILQSLNDLSQSSNCQIFFRPSFGRSGGEDSAQFGEFDFIGTVHFGQNYLYKFDCPKGLTA